LKKPAIVGSGANTRNNAPFDNLDYDIWVFNEAAQSEWCKRWTACFQMHEPEIYKGHNTKNANHWQWLQQEHGKPIYMQEVDPLVPDSKAFPLWDAHALAGVKMFTTTFAYMAALAVLQGYEEVKIYGVELSASEYEYQANGYLFWFGFLRGRLGTDKVDSAVLHLDKNIFEAPLYGYEGSFAFGVGHFQERAVFLDGEWKSAEKNLRNIKKAIDRAIDKNEHEKAQSLIMQFQTSALACGELSGALAEAERYQAFGDRYADRGGFEYAAASAQKTGEEKRPMIWHYGGMIEYVWNIWKQSNSAQASKQLGGLVEKMSNAAYETGAMLGMYKENLSYLIKYDQMVQANGGKK